MVDLVLQGELAEEKLEKCDSKKRYIKINHCVFSVEINH